MKVFMSTDGRHMLCLLSRPEEWVRDSDTNFLLSKTYNVFHEPSGFGLWVANNRYGLEVVVQDDSFMEYHRCPGLLNGWDKWYLWPKAERIVNEPARALRERTRWNLAGACARARAEA